MSCIYCLLLYTRTAVVVGVDAHNEVPGINIIYSRYGTHDDILRVHNNITGARMFCHACFASHKTLGWTSLQWVYARSARINTYIIKWKVAHIIA